MAAPPPRFSARLVDADDLTPLVRRLVFVREPSAPMHFLPGQWLNVFLPVQGAPAPLRRAYSIASAPRDDGTFEFAITRVEGGPGSTFLHAMPIGTCVEAEGPQGFFTRLADFASPTLFVATGTGLTPLRSMLLAAVEARASTPIHLILGARHESDLLYRAELEALASAHPWFRVTFTLSQGAPDWAGARGYVQTHVAGALADLSKDAEPHIFVCGLQRMVSAVRDLVRKDLGLPRERVHGERFD